MRNNCLSTVTADYLPEKLRCLNEDDCDAGMKCRVVDRSTTV